MNYALAAALIGFTESTDNVALVATKIIDAICNLFEVQVTDLLTQKSDS